MVMESVPSAALTSTMSPFLTSGRRVMSRQVTVRPALTARAKMKLWSPTAAGSATGLEQGGIEDGAVDQRLAGDPHVLPQRGAEGERGFGGGLAVGEHAAAQEHGGSGDGGILGDDHLPVAGDDLRRVPGAEQLDLQLALEVEMVDQAARDLGREDVLRERTDGRGGVVRREGQRGAEGEQEGQQAAHGAQRLRLATFWSISSEAWMDLEFTS